jgi:hypothetical protein
MRGDSTVAPAALSGHAANALAPARRGSFPLSMLDVARLFRALFPVVRCAVVPAVPALFLNADMVGHFIDNNKKNVRKAGKALFRSFFKPEQR